MKRLLARIAALVLCSILTSGHVLGQGAGAIIGETPVRLQPANPVHNNQITKFGSAVGLDGSVLVIGAPNEDSSVNPGDTNTGAVYIFERQGVTWVEQQVLRAPTEIAGEFFGTSVDVALGDDGLDFLIVGAPGYDAGRGRAYFFRRTAEGQWEFEVALTQDDPSGADIFGTDVAIDFFIPPNSPTGDDPGFFAVVGAPQNWGPLPGDNQNGSISIFQRAGGTSAWVRTHEFFGANSDRLGSSVAMAGPSIIAGAEFTNTAGINAGGGQGFQQENLVVTGYHYAETYEFLPTDPQSGAAGLGLAAAADLNVFGIVGVLGAPLHDQGAGNAGMVYVFDLEVGGMGTTRTEIARVQPPGLGSGARFGTSIALSGPIMAVGAPGLPPDGAVFLFERGATIADWTLAGQLTLPVLPPPSHCFAGEGVALQGLTAAAGCLGSHYLDEGVYLYDGDGLFSDGFESGNLSAWSSWTP